MHAQTPAEWACQRCGTFVCRECERRTRPEAAPLCPKCWALREKSLGDAQQASSRRLPIAGLVLGVVSVLHPLIFIASLIVNIRGLIQARRDPKLPRWMHVVGLALSGLGGLVWLAAIGWVATR